MERHLPFYIWLALIPALVTSDFFIEQLRNIKHPKGIEIYWVDIDCSVTSRFSRNVITSRAVNRANVSKEAFFDVELPKTAFITNFTMTIDGVTYPGIIKEKEVAQKQYQQAVSSGRTAGLVKASGRKTEKFSVSVNIAAASKVTFELTYEELLKRSFGKYELFIKVNPKQLVNKFEGHVLFSPTIDQQRTCDNCTTSLLQGDFLIKYDVNRDSPSNLQVVNGYFVHFFAPKNLAHLPKNVAFVIDISGSMHGQKIRQAKEALTKIVEDLREDDHFNIILFESSISKWKDGLIKATPENVMEAKEFIANIDTLAATNLNDGLLTGIEMLNIAHDSNSVPARSASLVIMLTDGEPNVGVSDPYMIQENAKNATQGRYPLYNLGFGYDVDYAFLERLSKENNGVARRIYEDSDAALQLQGFYDEVANPLLTEIALEYPENVISDLTQNSFKHYYDGSEIVVAGRITDNDLNSITAEVKAHGLSYSSCSAIPPGKQECNFSVAMCCGVICQWSSDSALDFALNYSIAKGDEKGNLTAEALEMSLKYKFVTPLTSMVVTKPEDNEDPEAVADKPVEGRDFSFLSFQTEKSRSFPLHYSAPLTPYHYSSVDGDPHFIIAVPQKEDALCFNINEDPGAVLSLIRDPVTGIVVNGELIGEKKSNNNVGQHNTYFGKLGIANMHLNLRIEITTEQIILYDGIKRAAFSWLDEVTLQQPSLTLVIKRKKSVEVSMDNGAKFVVILHQVWKKHPLHRDFLGFYTLDSHRLSEQTHGLLGQFFHPIDFDIIEVHPGSDPAKPDATMIVKNNRLTVTRGWQKDYTEDARHGIDVPCWFIHNNGEGLVDGVHTDYIVPSIF
ncbi:hypothetical protein JD844_012634 [Phrynosoma platyrhinos]|uniref:Inter-alpha-trypsin inhibitor heavy chain H3 n=1 Tax=Phrynosoma platyrhinos TaxID=52577 RepID=A0ABQ7TK48_PHRPL|nr:hypothetical protein JD844_012634 [Phrynosoma platyrhinos]